MNYVISGNITMTV